MTIVHARFPRLTAAEFAALRRLGRPDVFSDTVPDELARRFVALGYATWTKRGLVITDLGRICCRSVRAGPSRPS